MSINKFMPMRNTNEKDKGHKEGKESQETLSLYIQVRTGRRGTYREIIK